jgi:hypothetical protein
MPAGAEDRAMLTGGADVRALLTAPAGPDACWLHLIAGQYSHDGSGILETLRLERGGRVTLVRRVAGLPGEPPRTLDLSPDGTLLAVGRHDGVVEVWGAIVPEP